jgi:hypothetical protein
MNRHDASIHPHPGPTRGLSGFLGLAGIVFQALPEVESPVTRRNLAFSLNRTSPFLRIGTARNPCKCNRSRHTGMQTQIPTTTRESETKCKCMSNSRIVLSRIGERHPLHPSAGNIQSGGTAIDH